MIKNQVSDLVYYQFELFSKFPIAQGIFTRLGGASSVPWCSLNLSILSGDTQENVQENRKRLFRGLGLNEDSVFDVWLEHGTKYCVGEKPRKIGTHHKKADIILTSKTGLSLLMLFADCVPIFLYDPICHVIGIAHAGWQGTIKNVATSAVRAMQLEFGSNPQDILAGIGPSIGPDHYEVGNDLVKRTINALGEGSNKHFIKKDDKIFMNLWTLNEMLLRQVGISEIEQSNICTACNTKEWFSHRAENGKTGRFPGVFCLK